jgi:hypothetical protein
MSYFINFLRERWMVFPDALRAGLPGQEDTNINKDLQPSEQLLRQQNTHKRHCNLFVLPLYFISFAFTIMVLLRLLLSIGVSQPMAVAASSAILPRISAYVAPYGFPTSAFSSYYFLPATPTQEPQPALYDPVLNVTYPANLTNPDTIPDKDDDPVYYPSPTASLSADAALDFLDAVVKNVTAVISAGKCQAIWYWKSFQADCI